MKVKKLSFLFPNGSNLGVAKRYLRIGVWLTFFKFYCSIIFTLSILPPTAL